MILVTGGSGHTGQRLVTRLLEQGRQVRVLTRQPVRMHIDLRRRIQVMRGDLTNPAEAREAAAGCEAVFSLSHVGFAPHVVAAMQTEGVRRGIFMSSTRRFTRFPEETARRVIAGEDAVRASGLDWTIVRASMIYGSHHDNNLAHLVNFLARYPVHPLIGGGTMLWQPVFVWDVVQALTAALERPETIGREFTIAGPEPVSYRRMVETILRQMGRRRLLVPVPFGLARLAVRLYGSVSAHPRVRMDQIDRLQEDKVFDISEAREALGFAPVSFEEGIRRKLARQV